MPYQKELNFIREVLQKCHIDVHLISLDENVATPTSAEDLFDDAYFLRRVGRTLSDGTLYKLNDQNKRSFRLLLLPEKNRKQAFCIGPYLSRPLAPEQVIEIGGDAGISPQKNVFLTEYYSSLPILQDDSPIFVMLDAFCETVFHSTSFTVLDLTEEFRRVDPPFSKTMRNLEPADTLLKKKTIERRYSFENEMIRAVSLGQTHFVSHFNAEPISEFFESRTADTLQNAKNYAVIMNTLLRKGAEQGGVHPIYLNQVSSGFATQINRLSRSNAVFDLMKEMFRSYCNLVRQHSLQKYPLVVQKTILIIDADLSANLSPKMLAKSQGVSLGYLSAVFHKETGKTICEYIRTRRMEYAEYLLKSTSLPIQTISLHCGIMDAQYFSKLFKRHSGNAPSYYRRSPKRKK